MLYEPYKRLKKIIIIGAVAAVLAVLAIVAIPLLYKNKTSQNQNTNLPVTSQQQKIQKESQKLDQIKKSSGAKNYSPEEIDQQSQKLDELRNQMVK